MANYVKVGPFVNGGAPAISKAFLDGLENVLVQPSGGSETGKYWLAGGSYTSGAVVSEYIPSISRTSVPVSVTIDTADNAPTSCGSPTADHATANGFHIWTASTATTPNNLNVAGNTTINF